MPDFLTEAEVAELLGWPKVTLRTRRARLKADPSSDVAPPYTKFKASVRYKRTDVDAWLRRNPHEQRKGQELLREATLSKADICERLSISLSTLRNMRHDLLHGIDDDAAPPHIMVGNETRFFPHEFAAWLERRAARADTATVGWKPPKALPSPKKARSSAKPTKKRRSA
jgi:predicted DNA-binding transcriptional regulator AlpA